MPVSEVNELKKLFAETSKDQQSAIMELQSEVYKTEDRLKAALADVSRLQVSVEGLLSDINKSVPEGKLIDTMVFQHYTIAMLALAKSPEAEPIKILKDEIGALKKLNQELVQTAQDREEILAASLMDIETQRNALAPFYFHKLALAKKYMWKDEDSITVYTADNSSLTWGDFIQTEKFINIGNHFQLSKKILSLTLHCLAQESFAQQCEKEGGLLGMSKSRGHDYCVTACDVENRLQESTRKAAQEFTENEVRYLTGAKRFELSV